MISYDDLIKKHYILQTKRINPFAAEKPFLPFEGFGIETGEGWYDLLDELCTKIEAELDRTNNAKEEYPFSISQIKEKYAGLRFYVNGATDKIYDLIREYEQKSYNVCEECSRVGKTYEIRMWLFALCIKCATPRLLEWKKNIINEMAVCEKTINIFMSRKDLLTREEIKECNEAKEWLLVCNDNLERCIKQLNNEVAE